MNRSRAATERFALITGMGKVLAVTEIEGVTQHGDRIALEWQPLAAGHPLYTPTSAGLTRWPTSHRTPSPTAACPKRDRSASACAPAAAVRKTERNFAPDHELKVIQARICEHFGGSALALIQWIDKTHPHPAS